MKRLQKDQTGLAAIMVSVFIILVLTLVVLAFSQITRREQRQGLDRQLVTQAFYAAESGINEATKFIRTDSPADGVQLERKNCVTDPPDKLKSDPNPANDKTKLDNNRVFKYSCVLFDRRPQELKYSNIHTDENGEVVSLKTGTNDLSNLTITWKAAGVGGSNYGGCPTDPNAPFPTQAGYPSDCNAGMIRVLLMPFYSGTELTREKLTNASYTVYLRPIKTGGDSAITFTRHEAGAAGQGRVVAAKCDSPAGSPAAGLCTATIMGVPGGQGLFMHIRSIYKDSEVTISGTNVAGTPVRFTEAQAVIDSTGKASDVLKRLQVRIPLVEHYDLPAYVVETMNGICKRLNVYPNQPTNPDPECRID